MVTWMAQADSAHQIGLQSTLHAVLIAVEISLTKNVGILGGKTKDGTYMSAHKSVS
jgi:hypothetical protein